LAHAQTPAPTHRISPQIEHRLFSRITMNWRGRPLASHEIVVNTIGATRTRTGLRVEAELDRGAYPTGVAVSKAHLAALPIQPHATHGAWNYTISSAVGPPSPQAGTSGPPAAARRAAILRILAHPRLTGMPRQELDALAHRLAPAQAAAREQRCYQQRGGPRRQAPGAHGRPILSDRDRLLVAVVYLRQVCSQQVLADLLGVTQPVIGRRSKRPGGSWPSSSTPSRRPHCALAARRMSSTTPTPATPEPTRPGYAVISSWPIQP
jgi:hypothetical protein